MEVKLINLVLSEKTGRKIGQTLPEKEKVTIGRKSTNDIVTPVEYLDISRTHCIIYQMGKEIAIEDCNSSNGTYVNGGKIPKEEEVPLKNGDKLRLGLKYLLEVRIEEPEIEIEE